MTQNHYQVSVSEVLFSARPRCPGGAGGAPGETPLRFVGLDPTAVHPTHAMAPIEDSRKSGALARKRCDPAKKEDGKIRYFRSEGCAVPEREARSVAGPATPLGEVGYRRADCV